MASVNKEIIDKAYNIALSDLRSNYGKLGIYAGPKMHRQYWARDSFITSLGACAYGDFEVVKKNLDTFIKFQRNDGHIPARVEENYHLLTLLGIGLKRRVPHALHKQTQPWASEVVDSNSWFLISATNYINESGDEIWFEKNKTSLKTAAEWLLSKIQVNGLIYEGCTANWSDCNLRNGYMIYNNILAWKALSETSKVLKMNEGKFSKAAQKLGETIVKNFWNDDLGYFIDRIDVNGKKYSYFYSDGNLLSVWFGLVSNKKGKSIFGFIDSHGLNKIPVPTGYPKLDPWNDLVNKIVFYPYRTKNIFTWWGCVSALARKSVGDNKGSLEDIYKVATKIVEYGTCHEVLTPDGKPVSLWYYNSEPKIAWTAGMYIYAYHDILKNEYKH